MDKKGIDFFLSFQFLENKELFQSYYDMCFSLDERSLDSKAYKKEILQILCSSLKHYIEENNIQDLGLLFSGGKDSYIILHYLRYLFPQMHIYTFTLHGEKAGQEWRDMISQLEKRYNIIHKDIYFSGDCLEILDILRGHYSSGYELIGDEGLVYYSLLFRHISKLYPHLKCISGDGADILFGGLSLYKLSLFERNSSQETRFSSFREKQYFERKKTSFEQDFFYKYGEYFGGEFLGKNHENIRKIFFEYFDTFKEYSGTILQKQIRFNICFWLAHRQKFIYDSADNFNCELFSPFLDTATIQKILSLNIPDSLLLERAQEKVIIKEIYEDIIEQYGHKKTFLVSSSKIDFQKIFQSSKEDILKLSSYLFIGGYISREHLSLVPYFLKHSHWYENRMRIYLLLNIYIYCLKEINL